MDSSDFAGRVALVTGGSRGIGRAVAQQLARGGANVAVSYVSREPAAREVVAGIEALGRRATCVRCDVGSQADVNGMVKHVRDTLGPIDLLAHCGAISNICDHSELTFERWQETIDVNLHGAFRVLFAVKDEMLARKFGRVVMISSVAALRPRAKQIHYSTAKAGVIAMARCCAEAFAPHNVRVNTVAPGLIETEMAHVLSDAQVNAIIQQTPVGRLGKPEDIAELTCFLLSERASFIAGQTIVACGGRVTVP